MTTRYKFEIEYDGTPFHGWQQQDGVPTVQAAIKTAIYNITREDVNVEGAGRTDTGVHAYGQVAHADIQKPITPLKLREGLNFFLKDRLVSIKTCEIVSNDFHARFSAKQRSYRYLIYNHRAPSPILDKKAWHVQKPIHFDLMQQAANHFLGTHDFTSFRASECQSKSPIKTINAVKLSRNQEIITFEVYAPSFLHNQIRIIVGNLVEVGIGKRPPENMLTLLKTPDRTKSGVTAPPHGLYFLRVDY